MLAGLSPLLKPLSPSLIRLDHIFDFYDIYRPGQPPDFSRLDQVVNEITLSGATPFFSLSYTPSGMGDDLVSPPHDWQTWQDLVAATISHYSGRSQKNLKNVYYEVWNEPDLFGAWHYGKDPNYLTLYWHSAKAAQKAAPTCQPFKFGGPATTDFYPNWIKALVKFTSKNQLPLDFISWHQYSKQAKDYQKNFSKLADILTDYPALFNVERLITELGPDSEPHSSYDNHLSGIHLISLSTQLINQVHRLFSFEIKDGPNPRSKNSTGWGLLTYQNQPKPRYKAIKFLNQLQGQQLPLEGQGSHVTAIATKTDSDQIQLLAVNWDPQNRYSETSPLIFQNLSYYQYRLTVTEYPSGRTRTQDLTPQNHELRQMFFFAPNTAYLLTLSPL